MNKKTKILISVLAGVALCVVAGYAISNAWPGANGGHPNSNNSTGPADRVDVVYFHRTQRCPTCLYAEDGIRYTLDTYFADELASRRVTFQVINVEDGANADIIEKYNNASYLTLCINAVRNGTDHIEEVTDIWLVIGNDEAFVQTVKSRIEEALNGET